MMNKELISKPVIELAPLIKEKEVSPVELTNLVLEHAETYQENLNSFINFSEKAKTAARKAEQEIVNGNYLGMYHGIPIALKDNIYVKDEVTTMGSKIHREFVPSYNATVVNKLIESGAILTGKLNMHEYAWGITNNNLHFGPSRNPWDKERITGGSSGGSAAAVASDMTVASLGTDTSGSIRIPAALCGIVGLKPTYGLVSQYGTFPLAWTQDHVGPMTKNIKDAAGLLEIISGHDKNDPTTLNVPVENYLSQITGDVKDLVIGIDEQYFFNQIDSEIEKIVRENIQYLVDKGAKVVEVEIPMLHDTKRMDDLSILAEGGTLHYQAFQRNPEDFGKEIPSIFSNNEIPSAIEYLNIQRDKQTLKNKFLEVFEQVDVLISPTLPVISPKIGDDFVDLNGKKTDVVESFLRLTRPANLTGLPALSVPCGFKDGMPIGLQIIGPELRESLLLNIGYAIEQTIPLKGKKPELSFT